MSASGTGDSFHAPIWSGTGIAAAFLESMLAIAHYGSTSSIVVALPPVQLEEVEDSKGSALQT